jgi:hypothetical protein
LPRLLDADGNARHVHGGGSTGMAMHTHRECPGCQRPLIWFAEGELATGWRIDETEERRQAHAGA